MCTAVPFLIGYAACILKYILLSGGTKLDKAMHSWMLHLPTSVVFVFRFIPALGIILTGILIYAFPTISGNTFMRVVLFCAIVAFTLLTSTIAFAAKEVSDDLKRTRQDE